MTGPPCGGLRAALGWLLRAQHPRGGRPGTSLGIELLPKLLPIGVQPPPAPRRRRARHPRFRRSRALHHGGGWGIRTPEGFHPTRFPSVRHRPLGESSWPVDGIRTWARPRSVTRQTGATGPGWYRLTPVTAGLAPTDGSPPLQVVHAASGGARRAAASRRPACTSRTRVRRPARSELPRALRGRRGGHRRTPAGG